MKKTYSAPVMYSETYVAEQYVAASGCTNAVTYVTPDHGCFTNSAGETHCAFTASNCGDNATACCDDFTSGNHQTITKENGTVITKPNSSMHNCHVLSSKEAAVSFATTYSDEHCGDGVAALYGLKDFAELKDAFS